MLSRKLLLLATLPLIATLLIFVAYYSDLGTSSRNTASSRIIEVGSTQQLEIEEVVINSSDGLSINISRTIKPFREVIIKLPYEIAKVKFAADIAIVYIDDEIYGSEIKCVTWKVWYKRGDTWHVTPGEEPPSNITLHNVKYIILRKAEDFSTRIVIEALLKDGAKRIEEVGINGYVPVLRKT